MIDCELWHTNIDSKYSTLSYVWGSSDRQQRILVNNRFCHVQRNLWEFLNVARRNFSKTVFWIDALCIAKADLEEKNHQVQMMSQIYSRTHEVFVWLGPDRNHAGYAINMIERYYNAKIYAIQENCAINDQFWEGFQQINDADYWQRAWIVQEFVLPRRGILLQGDHWVSLGIFRRMVDRFDVLMDGFDDRAKTKSVVRNFYDIVTSSYGRDLWLMRAKVIDKIMAEDQGFINTGLWREPRQCQDTRDRIYSMLGLSRNGRTLKVDYLLNPFELSLEALWVVHDSTKAAAQGNSFCASLAMLQLTPASILTCLSPDHQRRADPETNKLVRLPEDARGIHILGIPFRSDSPRLHLPTPPIHISSLTGVNYNSWGREVQFDLSLNHFYFPAVPPAFIAQYQQSKFYIQLVVFRRNSKTVEDSSRSNSYLSGGIPNQRICTDDEFLAQQCSISCAHGIYETRCTPTPMKIYFALFDTSIGEHYFKNSRASYLFHQGREFAH